MLADDSSFVAAQRSGDTRTMRQIAERYASNVSSAEALVTASTSPNPQHYTEFSAAAESVVHGSRVSVDSNGTAREEVVIGQGDHSLTISRAQFTEGVDLAYDASRYVASMGDENSIPQSRRTPERVAQIQTLTSDPSFNANLFATRSSDPRESQSATDRVLVRTLESLGHLPPVNLGVEDSALSAIASESSLDFRGVERRSNAEPRVIFVDPVTDERFAVPVISPRSLAPGQTLADAYRESVNLHTGATRANDRNCKSFISYRINKNYSRFCI
jgi:hypothetical protein